MQENMLKNKSVVGMWEGVVNAWFSNKEEKKHCEMAIEY